ncbi:hypothetical protein Tsubulata_015708 [Turnera subulata]|uniref:GDSL esterase/lipase n=1 Tax=Turnera subulata TaxID=218843 RepID=A0A9Q0J4M9_9ROSI|nr:hypothetical protein Tsubulata_015708 [Turnera subulata]
MEKCSVFSSSLFLLVVITLAFHSADATKRPLLFIFGDSTLDVGTNNYLPGDNPALHYPYGMDYPPALKPTGRFSNGYVLSDQIARRMGYDESPPPYLALVNSSSSFMNGVNFASGGTGILDSTGWNVTIKQFEIVRENITAELGSEEETTRLLSQALFIVSDGGNDFAQYIVNLSKPIEWPTDFLEGLASTYQMHLQNLYNLGARKFGIVSIPPVGSTPVLRSKFGWLGGIIVNFNAQEFFKKTKTLLKDLSSKLDGMNYSIGNSYVIINEVIDHPSKYNFTEVKKACWDEDNGTVCPDRDQCVFFDGFHPTQKLAELAAEALVHGGKNYIEPINFSELVSMGIEYPTQKVAADVGAFSQYSGSKTKYVNTH